MTFFSVNIKQDSIISSTENLLSLQKNVENKREESALLPTLFDACLVAEEIDEEGEWIGNEGPLPALNQEELKRIDAFLSKSLQFPPLNLSKMKKDRKVRLESVLKEITEICNKEKLSIPFIIENNRLSLTLTFSLKKLYQSIDNKCKGTQKYCITGGAVPLFLGSAWYSRAFEGKDPQFFAHIDARVAVDYDLAIKVDHQNEVDLISKEIEKYFISQLIKTENKEIIPPFESLLKQCFLFDGGLLFHKGYSHLWRFVDDKGDAYDLNVDYKSSPMRLFHLNDLMVNVTSLVEGKIEPTIIPTSAYKNGWQAAFDLSTGVLSSDLLEYEIPFIWARYISFVTRGYYPKKRGLEENFTPTCSKITPVSAFKLAKKMVVDHHFKDRLALVAFGCNICTCKGMGFSAKQKQELWKLIDEALPKDLPLHPLFKMTKLLAEGALSFEEGVALLAAGAFGRGDKVDASHSIAFKGEKQAIVIRLNGEIKEAMDGWIFSSERLGKERTAALLCSLPRLLSLITDEEGKKCFLDRVREQTGLCCTFEKLIAAPSNCVSLSDALIADLCEIEEDFFTVAFNLWKLNPRNVDSSQLIFKKALSLDLEKTFTVLKGMDKSAEETMELLDKVINKYPIQSWDAIAVGKAQTLVEGILKDLVASKPNQRLFKEFILPLTKKISQFYHEKGAYALLSKALEKQLLTKKDKEFQLSACACSLHALEREGGSLIEAVDLWNKIESKAQMNPIFFPECAELMIKIAEAAAKEKLFLLCDEFIGRVNGSFDQQTLLNRYETLVKERLKRLQTSGQMKDIASLLQNAQVKLTAEENISYRIDLGNASLAKKELTAVCNHLMQLMDAYKKTEVSTEMTDRCRVFVLRVIDQLLISSEDKRTMEWGVSQLKGLLIAPKMASLIGPEELLLTRMRCLSIIMTLGVDSYPQMIEECITYICNHLPKDQQLECEVGILFAKVLGSKGKQPLEINLDPVVEISPRLIHSMLQLKEVEGVLDYLIMLEMKKIKCSLNNHAFSLLSQCEFNSIEKRKVHAFLRTQNVIEALSIGIESTLFRKTLFKLVETLIVNHLEGYVFYINKFIELSKNTSSKQVYCELVDQIFSACSTLANAGHLKSSMKIHAAIWPIIEKTNQNDLFFIPPIETINQSILNLNTHPNRVNKAIVFMKGLERTHTDYINWFFYLGSSYCSVLLGKINESERDISQCMAFMRAIHKMASSYDTHPIWIVMVMNVFKDCLEREGNYAEILELIPFVPTLTMETWIKIVCKFHASSKLMHGKLVDVFINQKKLVNFETEELLEQFSQELLDLGERGPIESCMQILLMTESNLSFLSKMSSRINVYKKIVKIINGLLKELRCYKSVFSIAKMINEKIMSTEDFEELSIEEQLPFFDMLIQFHQENPIPDLITWLFCLFQKCMTINQRDALVACIGRYYALYGIDEKIFQKMILFVTHLFRNDQLSLSALMLFTDIGMHFGEKYKNEVMGAFHVLFINKEKHDLTRQRESIQRYCHFYYQHREADEVIKILDSFSPIFSEEMREEIWGDFLVSMIEKAARKGGFEAIKSAIQVFFCHFSKLGKEEKKKQCVEAVLKALVTLSISGAEVDNVKEQLYVVVYTFSKKILDQYPKEVYPGDPMEILKYQALDLGECIKDLKGTKNDTIDNLYKKNSLVDFQKKYYNYMTFFIREMLKVEGLPKEAVSTHMGVVLAVLGDLIKGYAYKKTEFIDKTREISRLIYEFIYSGLYFHDEYILDEFFSKSISFLTPWIAQLAQSLDKVEIVKDFNAAMVLISKGTCIKNLAENPSLLSSIYDDVFKHLREQDTGLAFERMIHIGITRDRAACIEEYPDIGKKIFAHFLTQLVLMPNSTFFYSVIDENTKEDKIMPLIEYIAECLKEKGKCLYDDGTPMGKARAKELIEKYLCSLATLAEKHHPLVEAGTNPLKCAEELLQLGIKTGVIKQDSREYKKCQGYLTIIKTICQ